MTYSTGHLTISIPLTHANRQIAQRFAREQPTPEKSEQVYWNTLAVLVVNQYLELLEIPTDLKSSYSWNPVGRLCANVADIKIPGIGHLECRSLKFDEPFCRVPPEVWHDRVGYVIVQLDPDFSQGTILGFLPTVSQMTVDLDRLQSLDALLIRLYQFETVDQVIPNLGTEDLFKDPLVPPETIRLYSPTPSEANIIRLSQWFDELFEVGWQTIDQLFSPSATRLDFRFRSLDSWSQLSNSEEPTIIRRGKSIDLGIQLSDCSIVLLVELRRTDQHRVEVRFQVHPSGSQLYLPPNLQLVLKDLVSGDRLQTQSRQADNYIQLRLVADPGDKFSATLSLNTVSITEVFSL